MKNLAICLVLFLPLVLSASVCPRKADVSGDLYFRVGPSNESVRPRGDSRHKHWETGIDLCLQDNRFEFQGILNFAGAATFDNLDGVNIDLRLGVRVHHNFFIEATHTDAYALNKAPVPDSSARRRDSSVNAWGIGPRWDFVRTNEFTVSGHARYFPAGDEPVWFSYFTKPYSRGAAGLNVLASLPRHFALRGESDFYLSGIGRGRNVSTFALERPIAQHILGEIRGDWQTNFGVPAGTRAFSGLPLSNGKALLLGIKYRFGK